MNQENEKKPNSGFKMLNDPVHKVINLHPVWIKIIDTPEFQRLRHIKQLGFSSFVFPSGTHTRFEHSIGVGHLAWRMSKKFQTQLGVERVSEKDCLCVSIAGLCHDVGHGPFSHSWEHFMNKIAPEAKWKHENQSIKIFNRIWQKLDFQIQNEFQLGENERQFICDLIIGEPTQSLPEFSGKYFLFEIVANKKNGVDVDKFDYFARDTYYLAMGTKISVEYERLLEVARVLGTEKEESIHYRNTESLNLYHMFYVRWLLNHRAYKHRVSRIIEGMFIDALVKADCDIIKGKKLSEAVNNLDDYIKLNDSIYHLILALPENHESRKLIERIETRQLYKCVGCFISSHTDILASDVEKCLTLIDESLKRDDFYADVIVFDYGQTNNDPIKSVPLYDKDGLPVEMSNKCVVPSLMLPKMFSETKISCICRSSDEKIEKKLSLAFENWFNKNTTSLNLSKTTSNCNF